MDHRRFLFGRAFAAGVVFAAGVLILMVRNPDPLLNPVMYTEDGKWTALALTHGWSEAFFSAKQDYLVWGNIALLWIAVVGSKISCGNSLVCLPESIALVSYAFYAGFATLAYVATEAAMPRAMRLMLFAFLLLLPLGDSANEIIGR